MKNNSSKILTIFFALIFGILATPSENFSQTGKKKVKGKTAKPVARKQSPVCSVPPGTFSISLKETGSQEDFKSADSKEKTVSKGVLNGSAVELVPPPYPPVAKAVRASGAVNVQVFIDEKGKVVTAKAVSGHPLLRQASEQAALQSKFSPTTLNGCPVRISGIVVYNFQAQ